MYNILLRVQRSVPVTDVLIRCTARRRGYTSDQIYRALHAFGGTSTCRAQRMWSTMHWAIRLVHV